MDLKINNNQEDNKMYRSKCPYNNKNKLLLKLEGIMVDPLELKKLKT